MYKNIPIHANKEGVDYSESFHVRVLNPRLMSEKDQVFHYHFELHEIMVILRGKGILFYLNREVNFQEGDVWLNPGHIPHFARSLEKHVHDCAVAVIEFDPTYLASHPDTHQFLRLFNVKYSSRIPVIDDPALSAAIMAETQKLIGVMDKRLYKMPYILLILSHLYYYFEDKLHIPIADMYIRDEIFDVIEYIHANFKQKIRTRLLCDICALKSTALIKSFKAATGMTPVAYQHYLKILTAKKYLLSGMTVSRCIQETGFNEQSQFNKVFKKITGHAPLDWLKSIKNSTG